MKIYLGADHAGYRSKEQLKTMLTNLGFKWEDLGNDSLKPNDDYPDFAKKVARAVSEQDSARGILICDSGVGMAIVANRFKGVRAAVVYSVKQARHSRTDNDSNVLALGSEYSSRWQLARIIKVWLNTPFSKAKRHHRRVAKIDR